MVVDDGRYGCSSGSASSYGLRGLEFDPPPGAGLYNLLSSFFLSFIFILLSVGRVSWGPFRNGSLVVSAQGKTGLKKALSGC